MPGVQWVLSGSSSLRHFCWSSSIIGAFSRSSAISFSSIVLFQILRDSKPLAMVICKQLTYCPAPAFRGCCFCTCCGSSPSAGGKAFMISQRVKSGMQAPPSSPNMIGLFSSPRMKIFKCLSMTSTPKRLAKQHDSQAFSKAALSKCTRQVTVVASWPSSRPAQRFSRLMIKRSFLSGLPGFTRTSISSAFRTCPFCEEFQPKWALRWWFMPTFQTAFQDLWSLFASSIVKRVLPSSFFSNVHQERSRRTSACKSPLIAVRCSSKSGLPSTLTFSSQLDSSKKRSLA
mmetsp:Transcript_9798/g.20755  ORF Transcript_9798/g.20755 Transcript_9798/m.20755 type:complete len:287 (-) Transcript_9798:187-1047(-)